MFKRLPTRFSLIAVLLGLTACATVPHGQTQISAQAISDSITDKVSLGSMMEVPPEGGVDAGQARVVDEYFSASGRHCVRVELEQSGGSTRVICQRDGGNWSFTRSLFNNETPVVSDELLITTPLEGMESNPAQLPEVDHSSVADKLGTRFETHFTSLPSFDGGSLWNFAGTSTAGPANWSQPLALASLSSSVLQYSIGTVPVEAPLAGRR
jgi:hypothetical protein